MEQRISLITLGVANVATSAAFYERLGWRRSAAGNDDIAFFEGGGVVLALLGRDNLARDAGIGDRADGFPGIALAHNVREREEVDATLAEAVAAGARVLKRGTQADWGGYSGYFADPDGHLWEIAWNPHFPLDVEGAVRFRD